MHAEQEQEVQDLESHSVGESGASAVEVAG